MTAVGRVLWLDPVGGLAGDMFCAALLDAGADLDLLRAQLAPLDLSGWSLDVQQVHRGVFAATHFDVRLDHSVDGEAHTHGHSHEHSHEHSHQHAAPVGPRPEPGHGQPDRSWSTIRRLLQGADLPSRARTRALAVFSALAQAESRVHGVPPDDVVFHEVGALDSLIDIVGTCLLLEQLDVAELWCASLPLASGRTTGAHGTIPLPAPATAVLLQGWPIHPGQPDQEQVTPTGAALVAALAR
ncbi:MAG: LarC family nickel insertion protein, partial [Oligoflexia bacterium]|nr:LarC family nickel insertion protein [Oligoflexia bacterium]